MGKLEERILAKTELFLSSILEMRFGDGTGQDLQVKLARKEILAFLRQELSSYRREIEKEVEELAVDGLLTDGGHHKQWYLEKILKVIGVDLIKLRKELNTPNKKGDYWDWEDGIAP